MRADSTRSPARAQVPATTGRIFGVAARCFRSREFGSLGECGELPGSETPGLPIAKATPSRCRPLLSLPGVLEFWRMGRAEQGNTNPFTLFTVETPAQPRSRATQNNPVHPANPAILLKTRSKAHHPGESTPDSGLCFSLLRIFQNPPRSDFRKNEKIAQPQKGEASPPPGFSSGVWRLGPGQPQNARRQTTGRNLGKPSLSPGRLV